MSKASRDNYARVIAYVRRHPNDDPHGGVKASKVAKALGLSLNTVLDHAENAEDDIIVNVGLRAGGGIYNLTRSCYLLEPIEDE